MSDYGTDYTDKKTQKLEKEIESIYKEAHDEIDKKMKDFNINLLQNKMPMYKAKLDSGEITQDEYDSWLTGQLFQSNQWGAKEEQLCGIMYTANTEATKMINGGSIDVFAENANWTNYTIEHDAGVNFGFGIYDHGAVTKLIKDNPQVLPKWKVNEQKDYVWNKKKVNSVVTQGIVQGKKLTEITKDLSNKLSAQNFNLMKTHARTAMTAAQNSGRYQSLMDAKELGIKVYKEWMATLDDRTRDSHAEMDGERQEVGDKWHPYKFSNGCRYPGDPEGPPEEVYNCRCTLVGDVDDFPDKYERRDNIDGELISNMSYKDWYEAKQEYAKLTEQYGTLEEAQQLLSDIEQEIKDKDVEKVFSNIWKEDVTYADWEDKKDSIQAKLDYFDQQISKNENRIIKDLSDFMPGADAEARTAVAEDVFNTFKKYDSFTDLWDSVDADILKDYFDKSDAKDIWIIYNDSFAKEYIDKFTKLKSELEEFKLHGEEYYKLLQEYNEAKDKINLLTPRSLSSLSIDESAYSQARKDAAKWFTNRTYSEGDKYYSKWSKEVHSQATSAEHNAYYSYTSASGGFNRPLAGFDYSKSGYGDGWNPKNFVGVGNVDFNNEGKANHIKNLTSFIEKSKTPDDLWLQSGQSSATIESFLGIDYNSLSRMSDRELMEFAKDAKGTVAEFPQFISASINKGGGSYTPGDAVLNFYTPEGSEVLYVMSDGAFGKAEHEAIMQRGGTYRLTNLYRGEDEVHGGDKIFADFELLTSMGYDKYWVD